MKEDEVTPDDASSAGDERQGEQIDSPAEGVQKPEPLPDDSTSAGDEPQGEQIDSPAEGVQKPEPLPDDSTSAGDERQGEQIDSPAEGVQKPEPLPDDSTSAGDERQGEQIDSPAEGVQKPEPLPDDSTSPGDERQGEQIDSPAEGVQKPEPLPDDSSSPGDERQGEQVDSPAEGVQKPEPLPDDASSPGDEPRGEQIDSPAEGVQKPEPLPDDIARTTGDETKDELEKRKLRLELLDLAKPWWRRPQSIAAMVALVVAVGGWITTAIFSNLDAKLALLKLNAEIAELEEDAAQLNRQKADLFKSLSQKPAQVDPTTSRKVTGQIIDEGTELPIPGVVIEAVALDEELGVVRAVTDAKGEFILSVPDVTQLRVTATKLGFVPFPAART